MTSQGDIDTVPVGTSITQPRLDRAAFASPSGTLKRKAQVCILQNKPFFCRWAAHRPDRNPFVLISNKMKKELIKLDAEMQEDASEDSFEVQCQVLGMLLNHKVTAFHFPQELMTNKAAATALCRRLVDQRPHRLHTLVSLSPSTDDYWDFTPLVNSMVAVFPNIKVLRMDGCMFGDDELCRIADQLPKLRVLDVSLRPRTTSRVGISALSKLQSLKQFLFIKNVSSLSVVNRKRRSRLSRLMYLCFEILPQLHVVALDPQPGTFNNISLDKATAKALSDLGHRQHTLQLRRLILSDHVPVHIALPNLSFLSLNEPSELDAARFPRLSNLVLQDVCCRDGLMDILSTVGRQLTALQFEVRDGVDLDMLLSDCPNLSDLSLYAFGVHSWSELQPHTLRNLQDLQISFVDTGYEHQPRLLVDLMRLAPQLRIVNHALKTVHAEVFEELMLLARQRTSMRHLEEFTVNVLLENSERAPHIPLLEELLFVCTTECEQLTKAEIW